VLSAGGKAAFAMPAARHKEEDVGQGPPLARRRTARGRAEGRRLGDLDGRRLKELEGRAWAGRTGLGGPEDGQMRRRTTRRAGGRRLEAPDPLTASDACRGGAGPPAGTSETKPSATGARRQPAMPRRHIRAEKTHPARLGGLTPISVSSAHTGTGKGRVTPVDKGARSSTPKPALTKRTEKTHPTRPGGPPQSQCPAPTPTAARHVSRLWITRLLVERARGPCL
jgi:hypothetical protein